MLKVNRRTNPTGSITSSLYLTLDERGYTPSTGSYLLMKLIGKENNDESVLVLGSDNSMNPARYNKFTVTDSASISLNNAVFNFNQPSYDYYIYSSVSASILADSTMLEKGLLKVNGLIDTTQINLGNNNNEITFI